MVADSALCKGQTGKALKAMQRTMKIHALLPYFYLGNANNAVKATPPYKASSLNLCCPTMQSHKGTQEEAGNHHITQPPTIISPKFNLGQSKPGRRATNRAQEDEELKAKMTNKAVHINKERDVHFKPVIIHAPTACH